MAAKPDTQHQSGAIGPNTNHEQHTIKIWKYTTSSRPQLVNDSTSWTKQYNWVKTLPSDMGLNSDWPHHWRESSNVIHCAPRLKQILINGIQFPLQPLSNKLRAQDTAEAIEFGNHKGATTHQHFFNELHHIDYKGWVLLNHPDTCSNENWRSPNGYFEHCREFGEIVQSQCLTHNQSKVFSASSTSVNSRVDPDKLQDCMYGYMIIRLIHYIVALRLKFPNQIILMQKPNYKSTYRRAHLHWTTAIQTMTRVNDSIAQIVLRATFGGLPNPNEWSIISESICDLANVILNDPGWDPDTLHSPYQKLVPVDSFESGLPLIVGPLLATHAHSDIYMHDDITVAVASPENTKRARAGLLLLCMLHVTQ